MHVVKHAVSAPPCMPNSTFHCSVEDTQLSGSAAIFDRCYSGRHPRQPLYLQVQRLHIWLYRTLQLSSTQMQKLAARWHRWCRRRAAFSYKLTTTMHALLKALPTKHMLPVHTFEQFCSQQPADEIRADDACSLQGLATAAHFHHDTASTGGGNQSLAQNDESCPVLPRPSKPGDGDRDSNTQGLKILSPIWASVAQAGESEEPQVGIVCNEDRCSSVGQNTEPRTEYSVQGSLQESCGEDGAHTCGAAGVKDAHPHCQAGAGDAERLQHDLVMNGRQQGEKSDLSHPEGGVECRTARAGHTGSCAHAGNGNRAHEGIRCETMSTFHDNV